MPKQLYVPLPCAAARCAAEQRWPALLARRASQTWLPCMLQPPRRHTLVHGRREAMLKRHLGEERGIACTLSPADLAKVVVKTAGYSGSDMRALIQEACQARPACRATVPCQLVCHPSAVRLLSSRAALALQ